MDEHRASDARGLGRRGASQTGRLSRAVDRLLGGCMLDAGGLCGCAADDDGGRGFIYLERSDSPCSLVKLRAVPISGEQRAYRQNTWGEARLSSDAGAGAAGLGRRGWLLRLGACGGARRKTVAAPARVLRAWLTGGAHRAGWASTVGWGDGRGWDGWDDRRQHDEELGLRAASTQINFLRALPSRAGLGAWPPVAAGQQGQRAQCHASARVEGAARHPPACRPARRSLPRLAVTCTNPYASDR